MELRSILLYALVVLLAAGCHPKAKPVSAVPAPVSAKGVTPGELPNGWPDFLPPYPGSTLVAGVESTLEQHGAPILTVTMTTSDEPEKVHEFYGKQVSQHEFTLASSNETNGEKLSLYERGSQSLSVSTNRDNAQKNTNIELTLVGKYEEHIGESAPGTPPAKSEDDRKADGKDERKDEPKAKSLNPLLPIYPGASASEPKTSGPLTTLRMTSDDPVDKVVKYYEGFYKGKGFNSSGSTEFEGQVSEAFSGVEGTVSLNVHQVSTGEGGGKTTSINLSLQSAH